MDVAWSPVHPAVFAAVDIQGKLDVWDLNSDTEIPIVSTQIEGNVAINRVSWTPSGTHITVGDEAGKIWLYDVGEVMFGLYIMFLVGLWFLKFQRRSTYDA